MKRLVLCCDGTWSRADQEQDDTPCPTNVVKLVYSVAKRAPDDTIQVVYYDQGVGTGNALDRLSGGALGEGLEENIHDGYRFLIGNYEEGDEIYLFGFSRGAFTARSLAGMIRKCGILRRELFGRYRRALDLYRSDKHPDHPDAVAFRQSNCICGEAGVPIRMIGVWDTVGALGIPVRGLRGLTRDKHLFHDTELSGSVQYAYHALAIDERRAPFEPTLWYYKPKPSQKVEQVWFCGVHSDIGGGYKETGLSDITLGWMVDKARAAGLAFDEQAMAARNTRPDFRAELHNSKTGWYRFTTGSDRHMGVPVEHKGGTDERKAEAGVLTDPTQSLHPTVLQRWDFDPSYRPKSLREYFKRVGDRARSGAP